MADTGPSPEDIISALQTSGYLMEQEVATALEDLGFQVQTNRGYEDPTEQKSREIDVSAFKTLWLDQEERQRAVLLHTVVECKSSSAPVVFLSRRKTSADQRRNPEEFVFPMREVRRRVTHPTHTTFTLQHPFHAAGLANFHYYWQSDFKVVQFAQILRKGSGWEATHGRMIDATFLPLVKAMRAFRKNFRRQDGPWKSIVMFVPMIVVRAPMLLVNTHEAPLHLEEVSHVTFIRDLQSEEMKGIYAVEFVTQNGLHDWITETLLPFAQIMADIAQEHDEIFTREEVEEGDFGFER